MRYFIFFTIIIFSGKLYSSGLPVIKYGMKSYIILVSGDKNYPEHCTIDYWAFIPPEKRTIKAEFKGNDTCLVEADVYFPRPVMVNIDSLPSFKIFLIPQDTLIINLAAAKSALAPVVSFAGRNAHITKYYYDKYNTFAHKYNFEQSRLRSAKISLTLVSFKMDSLKNSELKFLSEFNQKYNLPDWFLKTEQWSLEYWYAERLALAPYFRKDMLGFDETIPDNYFSFWQELPFLNTQAKYSYEYYFYLSSYFFYNILPDEYKGKDKKTFYEGVFKYYPQAAEKMLNPEIRDIFLCYQLAEVINDGFLDFYDSQMQTYQVHFSYSDIFEVLDQYRKNKYAPRVGEKAFNFYLPDKNNNYYNLTDFKNRIVVLNFWFNGCTPCVQEVPYEKQLAKKFENDAFELINIHMKDNKKSWLQGLEKYQLSGTNLFANTKWIELLRRNYAVSGYPTYIIIDKEGMILNPKAILPGKGLADEIKKYLK